MPTPIAHSLAGLAIALQAHPGLRQEPAQRQSILTWSVFALAACLPDIDFLLGFIAGTNLHHHFTHSVGAVMAVGLGCLAIALAANIRTGPAVRFAVWIAIAYASHLALDLFSKDTSPPYGMQLYWPLSPRFIDGPWDLFDDIWRGSIGKLLGLHNWIAVAREIAWMSPLVGLSFWLSARRRGSSKIPP